MRLTPQDFEEFGKKKLAALLEQGEKFTVVGAFIDIFGDSIKRFCDVCKNLIYVRPWLNEAIKKHGLTAICPACAGPNSYLRSYIAEMEGGYRK